MILLTAAALAVTVMGGMAQASRRSKNRLDHYKFYKTCATCPRGTMESTVTRYDSGQVIDWAHKVQGVAKDRLGYTLFTFWQSGHIWANPPNHIKKMRWDAGTGAGNQVWNMWEEDQPAREVHQGRGTTDGVPRRYRRTEFVFKASYAAWTFNENVWAAQTFWADGNYSSAHN